MVFAPGRPDDSVSVLAAGLLLVAWKPAMAIDEPGCTVVPTYDAFDVRPNERFGVA